MKKLLFIVLFAAASLGTAQAQENAAGLRIGAGFELLYQRQMSAENYLRFTAAFPNFDGFTVTGSYNWRCYEWDWTPETCDWHLDAGAGAAFGVYGLDDAGVLVGAMGTCAFGCQFKEVPISIDIDYRPVLGFVAGGGDKGFFTPGLWNFGLSVAYHF